MHHEHANYPPAGLDGDTPPAAHSNNPAEATFAKAVAALDAGNCASACTGDWWVRE